MIKPYPEDIRTHILPFDIACFQGFPGPLDGDAIGFLQARPIAVRQGAKAGGGGYCVPVWKLRRTNPTRVQVPTWLDSGWMPGADIPPRFWGGGTSDRP